MCVSISARANLTVDHSARESMKDAASCEKWCELQSTLIVDNLNVHDGMRSRLGAMPRPPQCPFVPSVELGFCE